MERRKFLKTGLLAIPVMTGIEALGKDNRFSDENPLKDGSNIDPLEIIVSASKSGKKFDHFWSFCAGAGRANEGLRANWLEHLALVKEECGFRYLRFHGLFHDDMFVYREEADKPVFNWQYIDELFDRMLDLGVRPFVELGFFPGSISLKPTCFWWGGHGTPPSDFVKWKLLVENFVKHCISRYGKDEVLQWYFEVWNEPNLGGFWNGTQEQYFDLYKTTALSIKAIESALKVGGPATSSYHPKHEVYEKLKLKKDIKAEDFEGIECKGPWIEEFLAFCEKENLPLDFISSHPYPTSYPIDSDGNNLEISRSVNSTFNDISWLKKTIEKTRYKNAEIHLTEWSSSPSPRDHTHDYLQAATFIVKVNLQCIGLTNSLSYWTFTDVFEEGGAGNSIFHGGFGMINFQGIVKPAFHAYRMLNSIGNEELFRNDGCIITKSAETNKVSALICHYPEEVFASAPLSKGSRDIAEKILNTGKPKTVSIQINDLQPNTEFKVEILDTENGFALKTWQKMGSPEPPTREETKRLKEAGFATRKEIIKADGQGNLKFEKTMTPWSILLIKQI